MTRDDVVKVDVKRWGVILGAIAALVVLVTAFVRIADDRYVTRPEFLEYDAKLERLLDVVCEGRDKTRACERPGR